jgi:hypothetical protein
MLNDVCEIASVAFLQHKFFVISMIISPRISKTDFWFTVLIYNTNNKNEQLYL